MVNGRLTSQMQEVAQMFLQMARANHRRCAKMEQMRLAQVRLIGMQISKAVARTYLQIL